MSLITRVVYLLLLAQCSWTRSNVPSDPLWGPFVQALSTETGRTVQDLNTLGLSDPSIFKLWTHYSNNVQNLAAQQQKQQAQQQMGKATVTPPPLPDIYQPSYAFSANTAAQDPPPKSRATTSSSGSAGLDTTALYNRLLSLVQGFGSDPGYTPLIQQMSGTTITSGQASPASPSPSQVSYQSLMNQYMSLVGSNGGATRGASTSTSTSTSSKGQTNYDQLVQQFNTAPSNMNPSASPSYQTLVDLYTAIMLHAANSGANSATSSGATTVSASATPTASSSSSQQSPLSFEEQLMTYFPQFQSLFPNISHGSLSTSGANAAPDSLATSPATEGSDPSSNTEQMIFDALLFGEPPKHTSQTSPALSSSTSASSPSSSSASTPGGPGQAATSSPTQSVKGFLNMLGGRSTGGGNLVTNHIENVMKARASRDMGCRFLPELLELDVMPHSPINCLHKCPPPYINAQRFGIYCLCCPPGVNRNVANIMSIFKRSSYMESPFSVVS